MGLGSRVGAPREAGYPSASRRSPELLRGDGGCCRPARRRPSGAETARRDRRGPIVLCGHSYGGVVIMEAASGQPASRHLVYLCAFMLDNEGSRSRACSKRAESRPLPLGRARRGGERAPEPRGSARRLHDCSDAEQRLPQRSSGRRRPSSRYSPPREWHGEISASEARSDGCICTERAVLPGVMVSRVRTVVSPESRSPRSLAAMTSLGST